MKILIQNLELKSIQQISQYTTFCKFSTCFIETRSTLLRNSSFTSLIIKKFITRTKTESKLFSNLEPELKQNQKAFFIQVGTKTITKSIGFSNSEL